MKCIKNVSVTAVGALLVPMCVTEKLDGASSSTTAWARLDAHRASPPVVTSAPWMARDEDEK